MKAAHQNSLSRRIILPLIVGLVVITAFVAVGLYAANQRRSTADSYAPNDPNTYGIPEILAGYRIVSVQTLENTACMPSDEMRLTIQAVVPSADNPMVPKDGGDIMAELKKLDPDRWWSLTYIMPVVYDREKALRSYQDWNNSSMKNGCIKLGGPAIVITPTPDPFAAYAPATFGLPEIVAGYRIVAVHSSDNTPCMPVNTISLTIQAVDPSPDNPMVDRNGGDIIFEVKKLHPDIDWQLEYVMPGRIAPANRVPLSAATQQWIDVTKQGSVTLGGPEFTVAPSATP
jgi:hypothetical protein